MRHNQNKHSSANHGNSQHQKPDHMTHQYGGNDLPNPQRPPKRSVFSRFKERFQEKPATAEEVKQLGLNAKRETFKTQIAKAKSQRPSRFSGFGGGGQTSSRRSRSEETGLFGGKNSGSWLMGPSEGPSLNFITGAEEKRGRGKKQESGFGKGLSDLFT